MYAGHADVVEPGRGDAVGGEDRGALVGDAQVRGAGDGFRVVVAAAGVVGQRRVDLVVGGAGQQDRPVAHAQQLGDDRRALGRRLARGIDRLGQPLADGAVVVDPGVTEVGERQPAQFGDGVVGVALAAGDVVEQLPEVVCVHRSILAARDHPR